MNAAAPAAVKAVLGPTNTGKTHLAVERMLAHSGGMIGLPLRLLAREIYDRVVKAKGASAAALITGEEKIAPESARYFVCTVEAMPLDRRAEFLAIDEIQLARDPDRGHVFTDRILRARGAAETMLLGADTMRPMLRRLLPNVEIIARERLSTLTYAGPKKLTKLPKRTAIVAFSAEEVYAIAELIRRHRGGAAIVMGALSPRTRNAQVALYQSGEVDFLVATDAIGMGLNMDVDHVAFAGAAKFDGRRNRVLHPDEAAQIAGRAGRFANDGTFGETGVCPPFDEETIQRVEAHAFEPIQAVEWRNVELDFSSAAALLRTLEKPPDRPGLLRARGGDDEETLKRLMLDEELMARVRGPAAVRTLWDACLLPDFRKLGVEEHARLVARFAAALLSPEARVAEDWVARDIAKLDRAEGDLDVLQARLAHIRTWAYAANRADWLPNAGEWRVRARDIEDRLSDALHDALTQRFIDRRTSALLRGLKREEALLVEIAPLGDVVVEGHHVGRMEGLRFHPDPEALGLEGRAVRNAALRALGPEITRRLEALSVATEEELALSPDGAVLWNGTRVAHLEPAPPLKPRVALEAGADAPERARAKALAHLEGWLARRIARELRVLVALSEGAGLKGAARGLGFRLVEAGGALDRAEGDDLVRTLDPLDRAALSKLGIRIGRRAIFAPRLIKPRAARFWSSLRAAARGEAAFTPPEGAISTPLIGALLGAPTRAALAAAGYRAAGAVALRFDVLENLAAALRQAPQPDETALARLIGRPPRDVPAVLEALSYRRGDAGWTLTPLRRPRAPASPPTPGPFAALAELAPPPPRRRKRAAP